MAFIWDQGMVGFTGTDGCMGRRKRRLSVDYKQQSQPLSDLFENYTVGLAIIIIYMYVFRSFTLKARSTGT